MGHIQEVGLHPVTEEDVVQAKANLIVNPPRKFDLVRLETVFNYKLEFVEFSIEGFRLNMKTVPLPPEILGLVEKDLQERLRNNFRIFETGVPFALEIDDQVGCPQRIRLTEGYFAKEATKLRKKFISLGSYGNLIQKRHKPALEAGVDSLRSLLKIYAAFVKANIALKIRETRDSLIMSLYPRMRANPPEEWCDRFVDGKIEDDSLMRCLEGAVDEAFTKVAETFAPKITCTFKGVRHETIKADALFRQRIEKFFGVEETAKLFSEFEASRAEDPTGAA